MKTKLLMGVFTMLFVNATAQNNPDILWQKAYGGILLDAARAMEQTPDGGFILAGSTGSKETKSHGRKDMYVVKTDSEGKLEWHKALGGTQDDEANSVAITMDGGYILAGYTMSNDGDVTFNHLYSDVWLVKLNKKGDIEWQKTYGGKGKELANAIIQTRDGGYMVAGQTNSVDGDVTLNRGASDCWLIKLSSAGKIEWQKTYASKGYDDARAIRQTADGGYIVASDISFNTRGVYDATVVKGAQDFWIMKLDSKGGIKWQNTYGGRSTDIPNDIELTPDGGYIVVGSSQSIDGDVVDKRGAREDFWVVKLSSNGAMQWQKTFGGTKSDVANSVQLTSDGYIIAGTASSGDGDVTNWKGGNDCWLVKLDEAGNMQWQKTFGGSASDEAFAVRVCSNGALVIAGRTTSDNKDIVMRVGTADALLIKLNMAGQSLWKGSSGRME